VQTIEVQDAGDMRLRSVIIRQIDETFFEMRAVVVGDFSDSVQQVWVCIDDYTGPDPEPDDCFTLANPVVDGGKKVFSNTEVTFSDPAAAADEVDSTIVDLRDAELLSLGATEHEIVVQGLPVDQVAVLQAEVAALSGEIAELEATVESASVAITETAAWLQVLMDGLETQPDAPLEAFSVPIRTGYHICHENELNGGALSAY
ncbi:MAG: hypothetical protein GY884_21495, partial [Proteobacteria bacterium]|nr:hypothetical protein [Pseudomonadota bacterium]